VNAKTDPDPFNPDTDEFDFSMLAPPEELVRAREKKAAEKREPVMRGLRRILGDSVLDIFPQPLMASVDAAYKVWLANPDSYIPTKFDTEQSKLDALHVMRAYAECADDGGYTIRSLADPDPCMLIWRAQNRRGHGLKSE
jgi:hypothetical protein